MHELGLCRSILDLVAEKISHMPHVRIKKIILEVGDLVAIDKASLRFCFTAAALGTGSEQALLEMVEIPGLAHCASCKKTFSLHAYGQGCSFCMSYDYDVLQGEEFNLKSMVVE